MKILFVDYKSSENYDFRYMQANSLGGTESTVLKIARELAKEHDVYISQINRDQPYEEYGIKYIHHSEGVRLQGSAPDRVVILRKYKLINLYKNVYPKAKYFVWIHNFQRYEILSKRHLITRAKVKIICVSKHHMEHTNHILNGWASWISRIPTGHYKNVVITYIYNPIDEAFVAGDVQVYPTKLFFFSTVSKGLSQVLYHFKKLLEIAPDYRLYIAGSTIEQLNSINLDREILASDSVVMLGKITKKEIIGHLRDSFCVFYPQNIHPETFGLVYIEANCVGTPVLAHPFGAATEVISNKAQFVDAGKSSAVISKLLEWKKNGRPEVFCQDKFKLPGVIARWKEVLGLA